MSIIRLSADGPELFAPDERGTLVRSAFEKNTGHGKLGTFPRPGAAADLTRGPDISAELDSYMEQSISSKAAGLAGTAPAALMVHGFLFDPKDAITPAPKDTNNAHGRLYHFQDLEPDAQEADHTTPWPRMLGIDEGDDGAGGLAIAYAWFSKPGVLENFSFDEVKKWGTTFYSTAYRYSHQTAWPLLAVLQACDRHLPRGKPLDIVCHSMGSAVTIETLLLATRGKLPVAERIGRVIILGGSEYNERARVMHRAVLSCRDASGWDDATGPVMYNVASREDLVLDALAENFGPMGAWTLRNAVVGHNGLGVLGQPERWIDLQFDSADLADWMSRNHTISVSGDHPGEATDHWRYFTFLSNWQVFSNILKERDAWSIDALRSGTGRDGPVPEGVNLSMAEQAKLLVSRLFG